MFVTSFSWRVAAMALLASPVLFGQYSTPVRDVENPAKTPYQIQFACVAGQKSGFNRDQNIPAGSRFVVEHVTGLISLTGAGILPQTPFLRVSTFNASGTPVEVASIPTSPGNIDLVEHIVSENVRLYLDTPPALSLRSTGPGEFDTAKDCYVNFIGYLVKK